MTLGTHHLWSVPGIRILGDSPLYMVRALLPQLVSVTETLYPEGQRWGLESYFGSHLKWRMFRGDMDRATVVAAMSRDAESDSDQELPSEVQFDHKVTRRSRGTRGPSGSVQHDSLEWTKHNESYSQNHCTRALASHKRWTRDLQPVPFGLVIRIEDTGAQVPIDTATTNEIEVLVEQRA